MSEDEKRALNCLSLVEVMRANGFEPERLPKTGRARFLCALPGHLDTKASLFIDQQARNGADAPGWQCFGCGRRGFGAVSLQAALLGYDHTALTPEQMHETVQRLVDDHGIKMEGFAPTTPEQRTSSVAPQDCEFDLAPWTAEHLRSLGFAVKLATTTEGEEIVTKFKESGDNPSDGTAEKTDTAEPMPLYRCSLDRDYWRGRGAERTAQEWGEVLEREFNIFPCSTFTTSPVETIQGGRCSLRIPARPTYPIFAMPYDWGIKKYEPKSPGRTKWYWSKQDGIATRVYGDAAAMAAMKETALAEAGTRTTGPAWFTPSIKDRRHPLIVTRKEEDGTPRAAKMKRLCLCSGPRDAMQVWAATDSHVLWLHNELAGIREGVVDDWLRALLHQMTEVAVDIYVCYDIDRTGAGCSAAIALENATVHWVRLPREMQTITIGPSHDSQGKPIAPKPLKDVTDFVGRFNQIQRLFAPDLRKNNPSEALMRLLKNALTMQFWIDKPTTKKDRDGDRDINVRYVLSVANLLQFLDAKGIRSFQDERGQRVFYRLSHNNTYRYLDTSRQGNQLESLARTTMLEWIDSHIGEEDAPFKANLVNTVFTGKGLDPRTLSTLPSQPLNEHSWGEDFDHFFFGNTAVRVTKDEIKTVQYASLPYVTNEECILPGSFEVIPQPWRIIINPLYEREKKRHEEISRQCTSPAMRAAENTRWTQWEQLWKYRLVMDRPLEQMPMHFRFLYNLGRIFWEKESFGDKLTKTEQQMQDMHFINKCHAIGYAITRHRSRARQQIVHITDYAVDDEQKASGRNGKSAVIDMLAAVRPSSANVAGKSVNGSSLTMEILLGDVVAGVHSVVGVDELPEGFNAEKLYNAPIAIVCKTLYKQPVTLRGEDVPKLFIASNKPFDRSAGSTKGRIYPCFTSDYYHAATDDGRWLDFAPKDEFMEQYGVQEVANGLPPQLLNELRNLLLSCAQFFFQQPTDTILPPTETRSLRRELFAMTKDSALTDWLLQYFEDTPDNPHIGQPIPPQEMAISLLDSEGEAVSNESIEKSKKRIAKVLKQCLNRIGIVMDPDIVLNTTAYRRRGGRQARAWMTQLDAQGRPIEETRKNKYRHEVSSGVRVPRELSPHVFVHYFYRNRPDGVPSQPFTRGKEYEDGYVHAAAESDPEAGLLSESDES